MPGEIIDQDGIVRKLTWIPDLPDPRDYLYKITAPIKLPAKVDLRDQYRLVFDQGEIGSCTANAISTAIDFVRIKNKMIPLVPSRLFIYYNERVMLNTVESDSGAYIRDGIKSVANLGYCTERRWPYIQRKYKLKPTSQAYGEALQNKVKTYVRLNNRSLGQLKSSLAEGYGFVFGFMIFESFQTDDVSFTGVVPMPNLETESALGGHAVFAVGYDDSKQAFIVRNSWGPRWGDKGHFYLPYKYVTDPGYSDDFWSIRVC